MFAVCICIRAGAYVSASLRYETKGRLLTETEDEEPW